MHDLNDLYYFAKVVEFQGFAPAGRALNIPKSKLSRRVRQLEADLRVNLLQRSSRKFVVTDVGERFYTHCKAMLVEAEGAFETIESIHGEPCGTIKLSCPIGLLNFHVGEMLAEFMARYPSVKIELDATNRRVDVLGEGFDLAIRVRPFPLEDSELVLKVLSKREQCIVAAPSLLRTHAPITEPEELTSLPALARSLANENHAWTFYNERTEERVVSFEPRFMTTDMLALKQAALRGVGIVQLPVLMLHEELASGELVSVLKGWRPRTEVIHLVFPSRRGVLPSVRALIDFLAEKYESISEV